MPQWDILDVLTPSAAQRFESNATRCALDTELWHRKAFFSMPLKPAGFWDSLRKAQSGWGKGNNGPAPSQELLEPVVTERLPWPRPLPRMPFLGNRRGDTKGKGSRKGALLKTAYCTILRNNVFYIENYVLLYSNITSVLGSGNMNRKFNLIKNSILPVMLITTTIIFMRH